MYCDSREVCTECDPNEELKFLHEGMCHEECPLGYSPINNKCTRCTSPCATCADGSTTKCTSCDNTDNKQFLFHNRCIEECPVNTTMKYENNECLGCEPTCALCDDDDTTICKRCIDGLKMLENECLEECPKEWVESSDGSVCEKRTYLLEETVVYFPVLQIAAFFVLITLLSFFCTGPYPRSVVSSSLIAFFGLIEMSATFYQFYYGYNRNYIPVAVGSMCVLVSGIILNIAFIIKFIRTHRPST